MEQAEQSLNWAIYIIPLLLALVPGMLFYAGHIMARKENSPFVSTSLYWLGVHALTVVVVTALTLLRGATVPELAITHLPLMVTAFYMVFGLFVRSPFFFSVGLATPGLWMLLMKAWEAFSGEWQGLYLLPQDPFWYLLGAAVVFGMRYLATPATFWQDADSVLVAVSGGYVLGGCWLLALGQKSLLSGIGVPQWLWAVGLLGIATFLLWCARHLRDPLLGGSGVVGLAAGVYAFFAYYPWAAS